MNKKIRKFPTPKDATLAVIIPAFNAEAWITPTVNFLYESIKKTKWKEIEIIIVDDGSTDNTAKMASKIQIDIPIRILRQKNLGRLKTRKNGLEAAKSDYVFFLDSRVFTQPDSFPYLVEQMDQNPNAVVWNGHIEIERRGNPYARFWHAITSIAWRRYMANPRLTHYGDVDYDYYPKGTGCFFAPREYLTFAYRKFKSSYKEDRFANDDTSLIRHIAGKSDIYISPGFSFTYNSRSTLKTFLSHAFNRGTFFIDGFLHRGSRFFLALLTYLIMLPVGLILVIFYPLLLVLLPSAMLLVFLISILAGVKAADALSLAALGPVFAIYYTAGLYRGVLFRFANRRT